MLRLLLVFLLSGSAFAQGLAPLEFLVGEYVGKGTHPWGEYDETLTGEWLLGKTVLRVTSKSVLEGKTVFEDVRLFSFDKKTGKIRARQYAMGDVLVFDVAVEDGGKRIVMTLTAHEGGALPDWRYTLTRTSDEEFSYHVDAPKDGKFAPYVKGALARKGPDMRAAGPHKFDTFRGTIGGLPVHVYYPNGPGPYPTVILSPGGNAGSTAGYGPYAQWFSSWGYVTVIVAFNDRGGVERAKKFSAIAGNLARMTGAEGRLKGKIDTTRFVAAGHSLGGLSSVIAARQDKRFVACLALAPSGPEALPEGENAPPTFVVVGDKDHQFLPMSKTVYGYVAKPKVRIVLPGMNHMFRPARMGMEVAIRATAFLQVYVAGNDKFRPILFDTSNGIKVESEEK